MIINNNLIRAVCITRLSLNEQVFRTSTPQR